jgi:hypothetical protein
LESRYNVREAQVIVVATVNRSESAPPNVPGDQPEKFVQFTVVTVRTRDGEDTPDRTLHWTMPIPIGSPGGYAATTNCHWPAAFSGHQLSWVVKGIAQQLAREIQIQRLGAA